MTFMFSLMVQLPWFQMKPDLVSPLRGTNHPKIFNTDGTQMNASCIENATLLAAAPY